MRILAIIAALALMFSSCKDKVCAYTYEIYFEAEYLDSEKIILTTTETDKLEPPIEKAKQNVFEDPSTGFMLRNLELQKEPELINTDCN